MRIKPLFFSATTAAALLFTSCSGNPGINDVESKLKETIDQQSNGDIELIDVQKTNSEEKEIFGQKTYSIYYKAKIKFKRDCFVYVNKSGMGPLFESFKTYDQSPDFVPSFAMIATSCKKNQEVTFDGEMTFRNTEKRLG